MNLAKKALSLGTSAALVASLLATVAAPVASAALVTGVTGLGNIPLGSSSGPVTITLHEQTISSLASTGYIYVDLLNGNWTGTPVFSVAAGSLGASVFISGAGAADGSATPVPPPGATSRLAIKITGYDSGNTEDIVVTGLKVKPIQAGAVKAFLTDSLGGNVYLAGAFIPGSATATGILQAVLGTGASSVSVFVTSACGFVATGPANTSNATFSDTADARAVTTGASGNQNTGLQTIGFASGSYTHNVNTTVTETVPNCLTAYPYPLGTVGTAQTALQYAADAAKIVYPGETYGEASHLYFKEPAAGYLTKGTTLTLSIATAGVTFSQQPTFVIQCSMTNILFTGQVDANGNAAVQNVCNQAPTNSALDLLSGSYQYAPAVMSADHKSVSITVATASTVDNTTGTTFPASGDWMFTLRGIHYDVASSVPGGTYVGVTAALSNGLFVNPTSNNNAVVFLGVAASATPTTVLIGQNSQKTGKLTFTENGAGFFNDIANSSTNSAGANSFGVCLAGPDFFDPGNVPYAQVTPGTGVLVLRDGAAPSTTGLVAGTPTWNPYEQTQCYTWTVWTHSTVASTITIQYKDGTSGAWINVPPGAYPGPVNMNLTIGLNGDYYFFQGTPAAVVTVANRVFANQVAVTALSQPTIGPGTVGLAGNLQIAETGAGQLKLGEDICVMVMPRVQDSLPGYGDTSIGQIHTSGSPLAVATGGLVVDRVSLWVGENCDGSTHVGPNDVYAFHFHVLQQSTNGTGKIVISNIHYIVPADAVVGNVLVNVYGYGADPTQVNFQSVVSNAKIGTAQSVPFSVGTAVGATKNATFTATTKVVKVNGYVTYRFTAPAALAGKTVVIWIRTKLADGTWGALKPLTTRVLDLNGNAYFWWKFATPTWLAVAAQYAGDDNYAMTVSASPQARWVK